MADARTYIRVHDGMPDHPKVDPLSDVAFRLLIAGWCWCSRHLTDGVMPAGTWAKRGSARARRELLTAGLVEERPDGAVVFHDYLEHQRSADEVEALRAKRRAAGQAGGKAKAARHTPSNGLASATADAKQTASKTVPSTETETEPATDVAGGARRAARTKATSAPDLFPLTDDLRDWGREHCPHVADPIAETRQFLDHHRAKGSTFKDWTAAWRTWMRNAEKFAVERGARGPGDDLPDEPWWMRRGGSA